MTTANQNNSEFFVHADRRSMIALMAVTLILGATALILALSPVGAVRRPSNLIWWLLPVLVAASAALFSSLVRRRFASDSPEVKVAMQDEWRRTNILRASRAAFQVVLVGQWPLALALGFLTRPSLTPPRVAVAMATTTIMLGVATLVICYLFFDRE